MVKIDMLQGGQRQDPLARQLEERRILPQFIEVLPRPDTAIQQSGKRSESMVFSPYS